MDSILLVNFSIVVAVTTLLGIGIKTNLLHISKQKSIKIIKNKLTGKLYTNQLLPKGQRKTKMRKNAFNLKDHVHVHVPMMTQVVKLSLKQLWLKIFQ